MQFEPQLLIGGAWHAGHGPPADCVIDPSSGQRLATLRQADAGDVEAALEAAARAYPAWRDRQPFERARVLRDAARLLRDRAEATATAITCQQGKPLAEARSEVLASADILDWFAEEGRRAYGRIVPGRQGAQQLQVRFEPVGPVAALTPWNFPISQAARKVAAALAAGCTVVLKPSEEVPSGAMALARALDDVGLPAGALNLLMGDPAAISRQLVDSPVIRKLSFTGSVAVGKLLAGQAAARMKPCTMELGGHAPVLVCQDVDAPQVARQLVTMKFRNSGQACIAPTRFFVHHDRYAELRAAFVNAAQALIVGNGLDPATEMGPLANARRLQGMTALVDDARSHGATVLTGGERIGRHGFFYAPTVLEEPGPQARIMQEEPFGPVAVLLPYRKLEEALKQANSLPYGLAAYVFTDSAARAELIARSLEVGLVSINQAPIALPETPFGGVKESGYGREGGGEGLLQYTVIKLVAANY